MQKGNSHIDENIKAIEEIVKDHPATTHINFRREDEVLVDVPVLQAPWTARQYPLWKVVDGAFPSVAVSVARGRELPVLDVPKKPSEIVKPTTPAPIPSTPENAPAPISAPAEHASEPLPPAPPIEVAPAAPVPTPAPTPAPKKPAAKKKAK